MKTQRVASNDNFNWRVWGILLAMVAFGLLALIPYGLTLAGQTFSAAMIPQLLVQFAGQIVLYGILIWVGLKLGPGTGLGVPVLKRWLEGERISINAKSIISFILIGSAAGVAMIVLDVYIFTPFLDTQLQALGETVQPPAWQGFMASFYGGIVEEVMSRLFLLTLLAWLGSFISRTTAGSPTSVMMWMAIIIAGLVFGSAHLPTAAAMGVQLTPLYVVRTLTLNAVGIIYGWLYWKRGLESAMLAHFSTDIAVHVLGAIILG